MQRVGTRQVVIEAVQITEATFDAPRPNPELIPGLFYDPDARTVTMGTGEVAGVGDWTVRNAAGEYYVLGPDAFEAQFEPV